MSECQGCRKLEHELSLAYEQVSDLKARAEALDRQRRIGDMTIGEQQARIEELEELLDVERLASLIHDEWMSWSKTLAERGEVIPEKVEWWRRYWVPYDELPELVKDQDREWAYKVAAKRDRR